MNLARRLIEDVAEATLPTVARWKTLEAMAKRNGATAIASDYSKGNTKQYYFPRLAKAEKFEKQAVGVAEIVTVNIDPNIAGAWVEVTL